MEKITREEVWRSWACRVARHKSPAMLPSKRACAVPTSSSPTNVVPTRAARRLWRRMAHCGLNSLQVPALWREFSSSLWDSIFLEDLFIFCLRTVEPEGGSECDAIDTKHTNSNRSIYLLCSPLR